MSGPTEALILVYFFKASTSPLMSRFVGILKRLGLTKGITTLFFDWAEVNNGEDNTTARITVKIKSFFIQIPSDTG